MEAQLRESLNVALDDMWRKLTEDPATGVLAGIYYIAGEIEGNLAQAVTEPHDSQPLPQETSLQDGMDGGDFSVDTGNTGRYLHTRLGINRAHSESDRRHPLDATVAATCTHGMLKRLGDYSRARELAQVGHGFVDTTTGEIVDPSIYQQRKQPFPEPWPHFQHELEARLKIDDPAMLREEMTRLGSYDDEALAQLCRLFVSRAPQRRKGGAAHKDTIYGQPEKMRQNGSITQKVPLTSLTPKDIDKLIDPRRNEKLYGAIRERLETNGGKGDKAFPSSAPLRKPDRDGNPTGPVVRTVAMVTDSSLVSRARRHCQERKHVARRCLQQGRQVSSGAGVYASQS